MKVREFQEVINNNPNHNPNHNQNHNQNFFDHNQNQNLAGCPEGSTSITGYAARVPGSMIRRSVSARAVCRLPVQKKQKKPLAVSKNSVILPPV